MEITEKDNHAGQGIRIVVTAEVKEGRSQDFEEQWQLASVPSRKESGNSGFQLFKVQGQENQYVVMESWTSSEALDSHMAAAHTQKLFIALADILTHPVSEHLMIIGELYPAAEL